MSASPNDSSTDGVEEEVDIRTIDPKKLDEEARNLKKAEDLANKSEKVDKRLGGGKTRKLLETETPADRADIEFNKFKVDFEKLKEKVEKNEKFIDVARDDLNKVSDIVSDPVRFITNIFTNPKFITKLLGVGTAAIGLYHVVLGFIEKRDIRVRVLNELKAFGPLQKILDIRAGRIFFSADTSVYQGTATSSNTSKPSHQPLVLLPT